ncbi:hypothetical protein J6W78_03735 [bacterium]|nr:hypothetical protein [bacterium]
MKKFKCLAVVFILAFIVSCGGDKKEKPECVTNSDCGDGRECKEGFCVDKEPEEKPETKPECVTSEDCQDGKECKDGSCVTVEPTEYCGDGIVNGSEACDDGKDANDGHYGGCNEDCTLADYCGDGTVNGEEACDKGTDANVGGYNGCKADCTLDERCGDGVKNGTEECDDGENNGIYGYCNAICTGVGDYCGDGVVNGEEACDDGENNGKYGKCNTECTGLGERCGDAVIQRAVCELPEEETDTDTENTDTDAETTDTDTETTDTENTDTDTETTDTDPTEPEEMCVVNELANENCDEGELNGVYGHCNAECTGFYGCGDGKLQRENCEGYGEDCVVTEGINEECDYGVNNGTEYCKYGEEEQEGVTCKRCTTDCKLSEEDATLSYCGDAAIVELNGEVCDDGKATNGTIYGQCNAECTSLMVCGDGVTQRAGCTGYDNCTEVADANEICDGNTKSCKEIAPIFSAESEALCSECSSWDESTCQCAEYYSGNGCLNCDGAHFCNGHGTCTADRTGKTTCACTDHFTGPTCNECEEKYHLNDAGTLCIKDCDSSCGQASFLINPASHGHCDYSGEKGVCVCDPCWMTTGVALVLPTFETPECAQYTPNVPGC